MGIEASMDQWRAAGGQTGREDEEGDQGRSHGTAAELMCTHGNITGRVHARD